MSAPTSTEAKQALHDDVERAKREAADLAGAARERGREKLEGAKRRAADETDRMADAVETTAQRLDSDGGEAIGGYGHTLAAMMRRLAGGLRERDIDEFAGELATFARRQPGAFIAGSVALGFGVSRFLKASSLREHEANGSADATERNYDSRPEIHAGDPDGHTDYAQERGGRADPESAWPEPEAPSGTAENPLHRDRRGNPTHNGGAL